MTSSPIMISPVPMNPALLPLRSRMCFMIVAVVVFPFVPVTAMNFIFVQSICLIRNSARAQARLGEATQTSVHGMCSPRASKISTSHIIAEKPESKSVFCNNALSFMVTNSVPAPPDEISVVILVISMWRSPIIFKASPSYNDSNVFKLISSGNTDAIFQLEGGGMKKFMKKI